MKMINIINLRDDEMLDYVLRKIYSLHLVGEGYHANWEGTPRSNNCKATLSSQHAVALLTLSRELRIGLSYLQVRRTIPLLCRLSAPRAA